MNKVQIICTWIIDTCLWALLILLPFSQDVVPLRAMILFIGVIPALMFLFFEKKAALPGTSSIQVGFAFIFMFIFGMVDQLKLSAMSTMADYQMPLANIILFFAVTVLIIKIVAGDRRLIVGYRPVIPVLLTAAGIMFFMLLLYPLLKIHYQLSFAANQKLVKTLLEYVLLLFLVINNIQTRHQYQIFSVIMLGAFCAIIILKIM